MSDPFLGEIRMVGFNFAPRGWAMCQGQLLSIAQNNALFALLGTLYGGDGQTTFGLPDYRGRSPVGMGQGPGLSAVVQGEMAGTENVTLTLNQMPMHNHVARPRRVRLRRRSLSLPPPPVPPKPPRERPPCWDRSQRVAEPGRCIAPGQPIPRWLRSTPP